MEKETNKSAKKTEEKAGKGSSKNVVAIAVAAIVVAIIAVVLTILSIKGGDKGLIGRWYYEGNTNSFYYQFNEDKTGVYGYAQTEGGNKFTYVDNGDSVTLQYENADNENNYKYSIEGDTLTITDDFDNEVVYKK